MRKTLVALLFLTVVTAYASQTAVGGDDQQLLSGAVVGDFVVSDAASTSASHITFDHETSGTAGTGFGTGLYLDGENGSGTQQHMAAIVSSWTSATGGAAESKLCLWTADYGDDDLAARMCISKDGVITDGTSALQLGTYAAPAHGLGAGDVVIGKGLQVNGTSYFDSTFVIGDSISLQLSSTATGLLKGMATAAQSVLVTNSTGGNAWVIGGFASRSQDFDHALQTNPTLYIHSITEPDTNNTQWLSLTHNQTNGVIAVGTGAINLAGEVKVDGVASDGSGKAVCIKADGNLGTCSDAVGAGGTCTCG